MLSLSSASILVKNQLIDTGAWVILIDLISPDLATQLFICSNSSSIVRNGVVYSAFPFEIDELSEQLSGELPTLSLKVSNINRLVQSYLEQDESLGSDWSVLVQVVHTSDTQNYLLQSQNFPDAIWSKLNCSLTTSNTETFRGPFGLLDAYEAVDTDVDIYSSIDQILPDFGLQTSTASLYVKQSTNDLDNFRFSMYKEDAPTAILGGMSMDFIAGVLSVVSTEGTDYISSDVEAITGGWYRISVTVDATLATSISTILEISTGDPVVITDRRLMVYGAQISDSPLPYTPTEDIRLTEGILSEAELETKFNTLSVSSDQEWVTFQLGMANPIRMQVPRIKFLNAFCQNTYKKGGCSYAGTLTSCDKTLTDCDLHFPGEVTLPFLGFPGIPNTTIYA